MRTLPLTDDDIQALRRWKDGDNNAIRGNGITIEDMIDTILYLWDNRLDPGFVGCIIEANLVAIKYRNGLPEDAVFKKRSHKNVCIFDIRGIDAYYILINNQWYPHNP